MTVPADLLRWLRGRLHDDRGALAPFAAILIPVLLVLGGLVVDGTRDLNARGQAQAYAEEAARAGASAVDIGTADLTLDQDLARSRVEQYCDAVMDNGLVPAGGCHLVSIGPVSGSDLRRIKVTVYCETRIDTTLLGIVGIGHLTASADGSARPYEGVVSGDDVDATPNPAAPGG